VNMSTHPGFLLQGQVNGFKAPWVPLSELAIALPVVVFSLLQRKSSKAKEKKQKRLEERAAMDAVCAKVDAANRVTLSSSLNFSSFLFFYFLAPPSGRSLALSTQAHAHTVWGGGAVVGSSVEGCVERLQVFLMWNVGRFFG
jgi:hypothetical protein